MRHGKLVMAGLAVLAASATACSNASPSTPASPNATNATAAAAPTHLVVTPGPPPPAGATGAPTVGINKLAPVPVGAPAQFHDVGLTATVLGIDPVQLDAQGPGQIAGPGVSVKVALKNIGTTPVNLTGIAVNSSYGNGTPASATDAKPTAPVSGMLPAGQTANGVYAFLVPSAAARSVVVEVDYSGSANVVLVRS